MPTYPGRVGQHHSIPFAVPFFSKSFSESLAPKESSGTGRAGYVDCSQIGNTLPNPFRCSILSEEPLEGYKIWFDKADGGRSSRIAAGEYPTDALLAEYGAQIGGTVSFEVDFETRKPTDRKSIRKCSAFFVYDYDTESVKVLETSLVSLLRDLERKTGDPDYEDLAAWDLEITKVLKPKTLYSADMKPSLRKRDKAVGEKVVAAWEAAKAAGADIWRLTDGGNPFTSK